MGLRRRVAGVALAVFALGAAGCTAGDSATESPGNDAASTPQALDCPAEPAVPVGAEQAARCVYEAWITGDDDLVSSYGDEGVTEDLPTVVDDPKMAWEGCSESGGSILEGHVCTWRGTFSDGEVALEMGLTGTSTDGYSVSVIEVVR